MADFEGPGAITQAAPSIAASGDVVNPGGTQPAGFIIGYGNVIHEGGSVVAQAAPSVVASGYCLNTAGTGAVTQPAASISGTGNTGVGVQAVITQAAGRISGVGVVRSVPSLTPEQLAARLAVTSRRDMQLPRVPTNADPVTQQWFNAIGRIIDKYILGGDSSRLVSINDLVAGGIADRNGTGLTTPQGNLTTPPKVTGLAADGALASIIIQWINPVFPNYSHTELWRASIDDIGQAVMIQQTPVESYTDMVGSGSTKYYWARAVSTAGVKGDWSAAAGVQGRTGFDPTYVRDIMTSAVWQAVTPYAAYQYVRPTEPNGYQYACIDGGRTGGDEPTWPTAVGDTVSDGDIVWQCVAADARVPFVVGTDPGGNPAVFIDTAYIEDATITSAKIGDLVADKITTGNLNANLHVLSKLWSGFDEYANPGNDSGFWLGVDAGIPRLHMNTGLSGGSRYIKFTGTDIEMNVDIMSGADIHADDLTADSARLTRAQIDYLAVPELVTASNYTVEQSIGIDDPRFEQFLCFPGGCWKTETWASNSLMMGNGAFRNYAFFQTGLYSSIIPYDIPDLGTRYRARQKEIGLTIRITAPGIGKYDIDDYRNYLVVYILDEYQTIANGTAYSDASPTTGLPSTYLGKIVVPYIDSAAEVEIPVLQDTGLGDTQVCTATFETQRLYQDVVSSNLLHRTVSTLVSSSVILRINGDDEAFGYSLGRRLKCAVVYKADPWVGSKDDFDQFGTITVEMQVISDTSVVVASSDVRL